MGKPGSQPRPYKLQDFARRHAHLFCFSTCPPVSQHQNPSATKRTAFISLLGAPDQLLGLLSVSDIHKECPVPAHSKALGAKPLPECPALTEEGPCLGLASRPADLASFQSPHPLKVSRAGALPSSVRTRLRGGLGQE